mmetsp:Transcript_29744/g.26320  ORF Transcript_29744/g.26320 Transcript_29744/m.26320 type:complete len:304 (+) Transcript_29744:108-1019(+)
MLDQKEEDRISKIRQAREIQIEQKLSKEKEEGDMKYSQDLMNVVEKQKKKIKNLVEKVDIKVELDLLKNKDDNRDREMKKLEQKVEKLENYKTKLRDKDQEISTLIYHLDEVNSLNNIAIEKVQDLTKELEREKTISKRINVTYDPYNCPEPDEEILQNLNDRSIDIGSERGNLMGQSFISEPDNERHNQNDYSEFTLQDELGMLNIDKSHLEDHEIFDGRNSNYSFHEDDIELGDLSPEQYPHFEERKISGRNNSYQLADQNSPENNEISFKDLRILQLQKKLQFEQEKKKDSQSYNRLFSK